MEDYDLNSVVTSSERVRLVFVAAIRSAVRLQLGLSIDKKVAEDIARIHTLPSALEGMRRRLTEHADQPSQVGMRVAVGETAVDGPFGPKGKERDAAIVAVRKDAFGGGSAGDNGADERRPNQRELQRLADDVRLWVKQMRRFLLDYERLYRRRVCDLEALRLPSDVEALAKEELNQTFVSALDGFRADLGSPSHVSSTPRGLNLVE